MPTEYQVRRQRESVDVHYRRIGRVPDDPCAYCGAPSSSYDHVPPLRWACEQSIDELDHADLRKVPACAECNSTLSAHILTTLDARRKHLIDAYRRKYRHFLRIPEWSDSELAELEPAMAADIRRAVQFGRGVRERLKRLRRG